MDEATIEQPGVRAGEPNRMLTGGMLVTGHGIKHLFNAGFFVILPELQIGLRLSNSAIGTLSTIRSAGSGLANMPAGYISDRFSDRWAVVLSTAIAAVGIFHFLMGTVSVYWLLVLTATLGSMAISFWHPPAIAALSQMFANRRGFAIAFARHGGQYRRSRGANNRRGFAGGFPLAYGASGKRGPRPGYGCFFAGGDVGLQGYDR